MEVSLVDLIGIAAATLVFMTFCMSTLLSLRVVAIASNLCFIAYGLIGGLFPILVLHAVLLPMNLWRVAQQLQTRQRMKAALKEETSVSSLLPYMHSMEEPDGAVIFRQGDIADRLYVVTEGAVEVEGVEKPLKTGAIFGEIGFFASDGRRMATVRAAGPVRLSWIDRDTIIRVYRNNPDFALFLTKLMVSRLMENGVAGATKG